MRFLKWLLIIVLVIAGLILIVPLLLPSEVAVTAEKHVNVSADKLFHNIATYSDRQEWDPWLELDPDAEVTIVPQADYTGSTYSWDGDEIGSGRMRVDSVIFGKFIGASIWFGDVPDPFRVEWNLVPNDSGTQVSWTFISEGKYPFGKLMNSLMKGGMEKTFQGGLNNFTEYIEANPPKMYRMSEIVIDELAEVSTMVVLKEGTMADMEGLMSEGFSELYQQVMGQGIEVAGPPFGYYFDWEEETGAFKVYLGVPVKEPAEATGTLLPKVFPDMKAVVAMHYGAYEYFSDTYGSLEQYVVENGLETQDAAFEIYHSTQMDSENPMQWRTLVGFPLK